jgi:hypothetical protein
VSKLIISLDIDLMYRFWERVTDVFVLSVLEVEEEAL